MTQQAKPSARRVAARVEVPASLRYQGNLPDHLVTPAQPAPENAWRNVALTFVVVVFVALAGFYVFRPKAQVPTATWHPGAVPTASPLATEDPRYNGPPRSGVAIPAGDLPGWRQTFIEDFNGTDLAERWWTYEGQPDGDPGGWFLPSHVSQRDGRLIISASREETPNGNIYATGGISNSRSFSQTYGKFEIRFRMDAGYGINYVLLLWPTDDRWPPELNIAEDNGKDGRTRLSSTVHYGGHGSPSNYTSRFLDGEDFTQWHTVGVEWTRDKAVLFLDGQEWGRYEGSIVPRTPMSLAIQAQAWFCGGNFGDCPNESTPATVNLEVDWAVAYEPA